jgi:hypothetical protein
LGGRSARHGCGLMADPKISGHKEPLPVRVGPDTPEVQSAQTVLYAGAALPRFDPADVEVQEHFEILRIVCFHDRWS